MSRLDTSCPECGSGDTKEFATGGRWMCSGCRRTFRPVTKVATREQKTSILERIARSRSQERRNAKALGGRQTVASGATARDKADVTTSVYGQAPDGIRLECKSTNKDSRALRLSELHKVSDEAEGDEIPILAVEFVSGPQPEEFYVIPKAWALLLLEAHRRDRDPHER